MFWYIINTYLNFTKPISWQPLIRRCSGYQKTSWPDNLAPDRYFFGVKHGICFSLYPIRIYKFNERFPILLKSQFYYLQGHIYPWLSFSFFCFEFFQRAPTAAKHAPVTALSGWPHYWESRLIRIKWRAFINFQNLTANVVPEQWRQSETLIVATCSCPLLRYFGTLFRNSEENPKHFVRPGWYYDTYDVHVIWREKFAQLWKTLTILRFN